MGNTKDFWGYVVPDIITMDYVELPDVICKASGLSETEIIAELTKRRMKSDSDAEILACSRILSALIGGPDLMEK